MQLPIKAHYATLAMLALAERYASGELLSARLIAGEQQIPNQFLGQILQQLRGAGLIVSIRGSSGGFQLARPPAQIAVAEIIDCMAPATPTVSPPSSDTELPPLVNAVCSLWDELHLRQRELLEQISLEQLLQRSDASVPMFYI